MTISLSISVEVDGQRVHVGPHGVRGAAKGVSVETRGGRTSIHIGSSASSAASSSAYTTSKIPSTRPPLQHRPTSYDYARDARLRSADQHPRTHDYNARLRAQQQQQEAEREARRRAAEERIRQAEERARARAEEHARAARRAQRTREAAVRAEAERAVRERAVGEAWHAYAAQGASPPPRLKFRTVLWPVLAPPARAPPLAVGAPPVVSGLSRAALREFLLSPAHSAGVGDRARVLDALRRWHPDKVGRIRERVVERDRAAFDEGVRVVAGELAGLLKEVSGGR